MKSSDVIRVMVVDDDDHMRSGISAIPADDNAIDVVAQADDGLAAICMANDLRPQVIVMDIAMPLIDGVRATRHIYGWRFDQDETAELRGRGRDETRDLGYCRQRYFVECE